MILVVDSIINYFAISDDDVIISQMVNSLTIITAAAVE
jgi:hypothetical protein